MRTRQLAAPAEMACRRLLADRGGLVVSIIFYLIVSMVLAGLWRAAAAQHGQVAGYSATALTWYIFTSEAATCAIAVRLIEEVGDDISTGDIAVEMLRPLPVVAVRLAVETGRSLARLAVLLLCGAVAAWVSVGPPPSAAGELLSLPALALAVAANLALQYAVASSAFWLRDTRATWFLYQKLVFILGGMLLPLEVLPGALRAVAFGLPFLTMAYVPARFAAGHVEPALLLLQVGWLAVLTVAASAMFAAGQRRLQVVGG
jgi:viologen exporter family transport system permease protein